MGIIGAIIIGFVVGLLARLLMPGRDSAGFIATTLLGVSGAVVGSLIGRAMGFYGPDEPAGFIVSLVGAVVVLFLYRMFFRRSYAHHT